MALNTDKDLKKYYSISEVARQFGVTESLLRYWETQFASIRPRKSARGVRQYTREDLAEIRVVHNLLKVRGMKIEAARRALADNRGGASDTAEILSRLLSVREGLAALSRELGGL